MEHDGALPSSRLGSCSGVFAHELMQGLTRGLEGFSDFGGGGQVGILNKEGKNAGTDFS
jgi:hypothetical protein